MSRTNPTDTSYSGVHAIGAEIRRIRGTKSQQEFAELIGVARNTVLRYENGQRLPDTEFLRKLHEFFCVEPSQVVLGRTAMRISDRRELALLNNYRRASKGDQRAIARFARLAAHQFNDKENP